MGNNMMLAVSLTGIGSLLVVLGNVLGNDKLIGIGGVCILMTCAVAL